MMIIRALFVHARTSPYKFTILDILYLLQSVTSCLGRSGCPQQYTDFTTFDQSNSF